MGGALMGSLIEYWYYTKDDTYVELTKQGLLFQVGDNNDYMPKNQTLTEGNDDQGFWGLAVMSAAEYNFPAPKDDEPSWLALAQAVFNTQAPRWDMEYCNGGLRWQIYNWNKGWDYKNTISQGTFFALAARLALFTGDDKYAKWATKTWDWMIGVEFIDEHWYVYDGAHIPNNCTKRVPWQFTYNAGVFIQGAAAMYNYTEDQEWKDRLDGLLKGAKVFFTGPEKNIMEEVACEPVDRCNIDQQSFKAYLSRWLAATTQWVPDTYDTIMPWLRASALAATKQCVGGDNGRMCGLKWSKGKYDGTTGVGQQMAALEITLSCMIKDRDAILTKDTGGESKGNPNAGGDDIGRDEPQGDIVFAPISTGERAAAGILTALVIGLLVAGIFWLFVDETSDKSPLQQMKDFKFSTAAAAVVPAAGAAAVLRKRNTQDMTEKGVANRVSSTSPDASSLEQGNAGAPAPMRVSRVENRTERHSRRISNMPLGWPNNASMRSSVQGEPASDRSAPDQNQSSSSPQPSEDAASTSTQPRAPQQPDDEISPAPPPK